MKELLTGNEAIARGAYEAGVKVAAGYPGTPSTEILENASKYKDSMYVEWAPNEKVGFEVAAGAAIGGARAITTMKHVGLNVAADPLMTLSYTGIEGGFVACVADDPGMHSSQNEQDTRRYAIFAKIPVIEPSDSQEAKDYLKAALDISEEFKIPTILRSTTRVSHSRSIVELSDDIKAPKTADFKKDPPRFVPVPAWARGMRLRLEEKLAKMSDAASASPLNRIEWGCRKLGIIAPGIAYQYVKDAFPEASVLKLGWSFPFPDKLIREFAAGVEKLLVVEELEPIIEEHLKFLGIACDGKNFVPAIGELSPDVLKQIKAAYEGRVYSAPKPVAEAAELPARPPVLCPGCPHRGIFAALKNFDIILTGDIGCYSLGVMPPLSKMDTILCMGGGVSMAHGMQKAGNTKKMVGMVGDSTFFHSGITGLLDIAYNKGTSTIIVVDNRITAMTGHQDNPGTGKTLMGEETGVVSIQELGKACGIKRVRTVNPYKMKETYDVLKEEIEADEPSLIVSVAPCPLHVAKRVGSPKKILQDKCKKCGACIKVGCPAIEKAGNTITVNEFLCSGCSICEQTCKFGAIVENI